MVPFRKSTESFQDMEPNESQGIQLQQELPRPSNMRIENNPLDEYNVFSDSEEEREYIEWVNSVIPQKISCPRIKHIGIQCDLVQVRSLSDILKLFSPSIFDNASKAELQELVRISKLVYEKYLINGENSMPSSSTDANLKNTKSTRIPKRFSTKNVQYNESDSESNSDNENLKKKPTNNCVSGIDRLSTANTELMKKMPQEFVNNLDQSMNEVHNERVNKKTLKRNLTNRKNVENFKEKPRACEPMTLPKRKKCSSKAKQITDNSSTLDTANGKFKVPLLGLNAKEKNHTINRSYSLPTTQKTTRPKPHFASFQSHLKSRTLYSPREWLNSKEFENLVSAE